MKDWRFPGAPRPKNLSASPRGADALDRGAVERHGDERVEGNNPSPAVGRKCDLRLVFAWRQGDRVGYTSIIVPCGSPLIAM
jgi:hypothetical protein